MYVGTPDGSNGYEISVREYEEIIAHREQLAILRAEATCNYDFKEGWWCSQEKGHPSPCALRPE